MASYGSIATASELNGGGADTLTVSKPSGLSAGDLMVAIIAICNNAGTGSISGFTTLTSAADASNMGLTILWKIANSSDAAASNFTVSYSASASDAIVVHLIRVTGSFAGAANIQFTTDVNTASTTTHTFTPGLTPITTSDLLIMGALNRDGVSQSGYAITNNNPTWTERADVRQAGSGSDDTNLSSATATPTAASDTGDFQITLDGSHEAIGYLISITDSADVAISPAVISAVSSVIEPAVAGGANVSPTVVSFTASVQAPSVTTAAPAWSNPDKSSAPTWTNPDKS